MLVSLRSPESQRSYCRSIDDFVCWYCSEPRLSFNKTVVTRYRMHLEDKFLVPGTINVRLAAVRRLAYEAADSGLLSPELAAGIRGVKGAKKLGMRLGNWLTLEDARSLLQLRSAHTLKGKRDRAILAILLGCGLRRGELIDLKFDHIQRREDRWAIVDLVGKGSHVRTVPMPDWVKDLRLASTAAATSADRNAYQLLNNVYLNMGKLSDKYVNMRASMTYIEPNALQNDELNQRIISCGHFLWSDGRERAIQRRWLLPLSFKLEII